MESRNARSDVVDELGYADGNRGKLIPFSYIGGKYKHLNWLLPLLPETKSYVEPFGGSGVVLLNREQSDVETFNDKYSDVVTFFRALRNSPDELIEKITLTPYSEQEFETALERPDDLDDVEHARRFFVVANMSFNNIVEGGSWSYNKKYSSRGVSKKVSSYQAKLRRLQPIADRMTDVQVCNEDALDVVERFDTDETLFYCDPPYPEGTRANDLYVEEMTDEKHIEMAEVLKSVEGKVAISSYQSELYEELFVADGWTRVDAEAKKLSATVGEGSERTESLYVNYKITDEMMAEAFD